MKVYNSLISNVAAGILLVAAPASSARHSIRRHATAGGGIESDTDTHHSTKDRSLLDDMSMSMPQDLTQLNSGTLILSEEEVEALLKAASDQGYNIDKSTAMEVLASLGDEDVPAHHHGDDEICKLFLVLLFNKEYYHHFWFGDKFIEAVVDKICGGKTTTTTTSTVMTTTTTSSTGDPNALTDDQKFCIGALVGAQFVLAEGADYSQWFDENSVMNLAQTGSFYGADGIKEYVKFVYDPFLFLETGIYDIPFNPFTDSPGDSTIPNVDTIVRDGQKCEVTVATKLCQTFPGPQVDTSSIGQSADLVLGYRLFFDVEEFDPPFTQSKILVNKVNVYIPDAYLVELFGAGFVTDAMRQNICEIMRDSCAPIWEMNFEEADRTIPNCVQEMAKLDPVESATFNAVNLGGYIDGNSSGCRILHSAFAEKNPFHCPHISFMPVADPAGGIICQDETTANRVNPEELFGTANLLFFETVGQAFYGLPEEYSYSSTETCGDKYPNDFPSN